MTTSHQNPFLEQLAATVREVALAEIVPRFRKLDRSEIVGKPTEEDPTDLVTLADRAAEAVLTERLPLLVPGSRVVGEEAVATDATVLRLLRESAPVWVVDPLDGTRNFAAGHGPFGSMVALVERGVLLAAAIYLPLEDRMFTAERSAGAFLDGQRLEPRERAPVEALSGTVYSKFMPPEQGKRLEDAVFRNGHTQVPHVICAAHEYTEIALGRKDYVVYHRLLPWDHAPGALIVREAGGAVRHPDGRDYELFDEREPTLLAPSSSQWQRSCAELFG